MIKQTLEISAEPAHLCVRNNQLLIQRDGHTIAQTPCEDLGVVLVDNAATTYTHSALDQLARNDAMLVICGPNHLPSAMLLPLSVHSQVVWRVQHQINAKKTLNKSLWKQIIVEKIESQARNLPSNVPAARKLLELTRRVRAGDTSNVEAQAAKIYWQNWLWQEEFRRDQNGAGLNSFLNYGYAVLRAALSRAIVAAGMIPSIGIHHRNRSNQFCLADDLIEPLRAIVDDRAREMYRQGYETLDQEGKSRLLELLTIDSKIGSSTGPLMVSLHRYVASLTKCYDGTTVKLEFVRQC